jgi:hypothetical protein
MKQNFVIVALILAIVLLVCGYCEKKGQLTYLEKQFSKFELKKQDFKVIVNKNKEKLIQQEQLILTLQQAKNLNVIDSKDWKNTQSRVEFVTQTRIDTIFIAFNDTLRINDTIYSKSNFDCLKHFNLSDKFFYINGNLLENGIKIDSLSFPNIATITIGEKRQGIFKKSLPIVEIKNSNPYIKTIDLSNVVINNKKKTYQKNSFWFTIGTSLGFLGTLILITSIQ